MAKVVKVTSVQVAAARLAIKLAERRGETVEPAVVAIASARKPTPEELEVHLREAQ